MTEQDVVNAIFERLLEVYVLCRFLLDNVGKNWCILGVMELYVQSWTPPFWANTGSITWE
jgi:hypothetical protein